MGRHCRAGRILHYGLRKIDLRLMLRGQPIERVDVRAVRLARHPDCSNSMEAENAKQVVVAGVVDERRVTRPHQQANQQIERLACCGR